MRLGSSRHRVVLVAVLALLAVPSVAHAQYLDPGAGSILIQMIIAGVVGLAAVTRLYWRRIADFLSRFFKRRPDA